MMISKDGFFKGCLYRLAYWGCGWDHNDVPTNICPFIRKVIWGIFVILLTIIVSVVVSIAVLDPVVSLILYIFGVGTGPYFSEFSIVVGSSLWIGTTILSVMVYLTETDSGEALVKKVTSKASKVSETSSTLQVIKQWFKAIHDKTCFEIVFKEEK